MGEICRGRELEKYLSRKEKIERDLDHEEKRRMPNVVEKQLENKDTSSEEMGGGPVEEEDRSEDWSSDAYREALEKELRRREEVGTTSEEEEMNDIDGGGKKYGSIDEKECEWSDDNNCDEILKRAAMLRI